MCIVDLLPGPFHCSINHAKVPKIPAIPHADSSNSLLLPLNGAPSDSVGLGRGAMLASPLIIRSAKPGDEGVDMASVNVPIMTAVPPVANDTGFPDTVI